MDADIDADSESPLNALPDGSSVIWTGAIYFDDPTDVTFYLSSTDFGELFIDGQSVDSTFGVYNSGEGVYEMNDRPSPELHLAAGWHTLKVTFQDQYDEGDSGLILSYDTGAGEVAVPSAGRFQPR